MKLRIAGLWAKNRTKELINTKLTTLQRRSKHVCVWGMTCFLLAS